MKIKNRIFLKEVLLILFIVCLFSLPAVAASGTTLSGTYFAGEMTAGTEFSTNLIQYNADGNGGLTRQILYSSGSGASGGGDTYSVKTDGMISVSDMKGVVSTDGEVFVINSAVASNSPYMQVAVKQASGMSTAKLAGNYTLMLMGLSDPDGLTGIFNAVFDGNGSMTATLSAPESAQTSLSHTTSGTYSVNSNGRMTFTETGLTDADQGAVTSDGEIFVLIGIGTNQDTSPYFAIGIRQGAGMSLTDFSGDFYYNELLAESYGTEFTGYVTNATADGTGQLSIEELYNTCGCPLNSDSFDFTMNANGQVAIDSTKAGVLAAGKNIFALIGYNYVNDAFFGIGILESSDTDTTDDDDTDTDNGGGGGGGGGCFITSTTFGN